MWDGDYIKPGFKVGVTEPAMVRGFKVYQDFYAEGVLPQHIASIQHAEKQRMAQEGQGAFTFDVLGKIYSTFRNPDNKYADWDVAGYPLAKEIQSKYEFGPAQTAIWSMAIPKNAKHKDISWEYIKYISSARSSLVMALNGNGPVRASVFEEPEFKSGLPYAELAGQQALEARPMFPAFDKVNEIELIVNEYIERIMLGQMTPEAGTRELATKMKEISNLLK
jgi:multiple sugar transport system substrate-binding protein